MKYLLILEAFMMWQNLSYSLCLETSACDQITYLMNINIQLEAWFAWLIDMAPYPKGIIMYMSHMRLMIDPLKFNIYYVGFEFWLQVIMQGNFTLITIVH